LPGKRGPEFKLQYHQKKKERKNGKEGGKKEWEGRRKERKNGKEGGKEEGRKERGRKREGRRKKRKVLKLCLFLSNEECTTQQTLIMILTHLDPFLFLEYKNVPKTLGNQNISQEMKSTYGEVFLCFWVLPLLSYIFPLIPHLLLSADQRAPYPAAPASGTALGPERSPAHIFAISHNKMVSSMQLPCTKWLCSGFPPIFPAIGWCL
jgi:hypothetical protein